MSLHDTDALVVETSGTAESLPDPATVAFRSHDLTNTGSATAVWTSTGATPFTEAGVNVATISVGAGQRKRVQSDGTRWIVKADGSARRVFAATGVSDASGNVTFTFPPFSTAPVVAHAAQTAITDVTECRVAALSASAVTFNVRRSPSVVVLGVSVLQVPVPASGVTVHCLAVEAGQT